MKIKAYLNITVSKVFEFFKENYKNFNMKVKINKMNIIKLFNLKTKYFVYSF
jgi:hypothetical protein